MIRVLFVCLGNICRSPMAEAVMRHRVKDAGLAGGIEVDSAGTGDWHLGEPPHQGTASLLARHRIDLTGILARQVEPEDWRDFDYILAMDEQNLQDMLPLLGHTRDDLTTSGAHPLVGFFTDFVPNARSRDVPDPYFTGNFEEVYQLVETGCSNLLDRIRGEHKL